MPPQNELTLLTLIFLIHKLEIQNPNRLYHCEEYIKKYIFKAPGSEGVYDTGAIVISVVYRASMRLGTYSAGAQLCLILYDPMDCSPPGSSVCVIFQVRMLEWIAISFSRGSSQPRQGLNLSLLHLLPSRWIIYQCAT